MSRPAMPSVACLDDDTVVRLLAEAARAEIEAHVDGCVDCRELVAALADEAAVVAPPDRPLPARTLEVLDQRGVAERFSRRAT